MEPAAAVNNTSLDTLYLDAGLSDVNIYRVVERHGVGMVVACVGDLSLAGNFATQELPTAAVIHLPPVPANASMHYKTKHEQNPGRHSKALYLQQQPSVESCIMP